MLHGVRGSTIFRVGCLAKHTCVLLPRGCRLEVGYNRSTREYTSHNERDAHYNTCSSASTVHSSSYLTYRSHATTTDVKKYYIIIVIMLYSMNALQWKWSRHSSPKTPAGVAHDGDVTKNRPEFILFLRRDSPARQSCYNIIIPECR